MIERNLNNVERIFRLICGLALASWALTQPYMNGIEWFVMLVSISLMLNGVFSRCYLWYILNIDTSKTPQDTPQPSTLC